MREGTGIGLSVLCAITAGALLACASSGAPYSEVARQKPVASGHARIVMLRPDNRFDDYSLSRAVVRVNDHKAGKLAYGGFLFVDVDAGVAVVKASARNPMFGACELRIETAVGDTVYLDVAPRSANVVADVAGTVVGATLAGGPGDLGLSDVPVDNSAVHAAAASTAGGAAASVAESAGKKCGGPFRLTQLEASTALEQLGSLNLSK